MKYLLMFLIALSANAEFIKQADVGVCKDGIALTRSKAKCGSDCIEIKKGYNCEYYVLAEVDGKMVAVEDIDKKNAYLDLQSVAEIKKAAVKMAIKAIECGKTVIATMLAQNAPKNLTGEQVKQILSGYAEIKSLLHAGSLDTARAEIVAASVDGVLITEDDKTALLEQLDGCKP
jgi:hypothetical protein